MPIKKYSFFLFLSIFLLGLSAVAQEDDTLTSYIKNLENRFDVRFSYADQTLKKARYDSLPFYDNIEANLSYIEKHSTLKFIKTGKFNYAIRHTPKAELSSGIPQKLEEVVVSNYISKGITKRTTGTFQIDFRNLGSLPGLIEPDALQSIQTLPGVESVNETVSTLNIRGGNNDQNLVLWDGIRMYQTGHFFGLISAFNPYQTERVSLTKNGTNPAFGNSVSGMISMETDNEVNKEFYGEVGVNYISAHTFFDIPLDTNQSIQIAGRTSYNNLLRTPTYNQYYDRAFQNSEIVNPEQNNVNNNEDFSFNDLSLRYLYQISDHDRLRVNLIRIANELTFQENAVVDGAIQSRTSYLRQNSRGVGANYRRLWGNRFQTEVQLYFTNYELGSENSNLQDNEELTQKNELLENSLKVNSLFYWNENFTWQNGYEVTQTTVNDLQQINNSPNQNFSRNDFLRQAFFSALKFQSDNSKTGVQAGFRFNHFNRLDKLRLEPRFAFNQKLLENLQLEVLGEFKSQIITQITDFQNDFLGLQKQRWQLSDGSELPIIKSQQVSAGLNYKNKNWLVSVVPYFKNVDNISSQAQAFQNQYQFIRITGGYFTQGVDVLLRKKIDPFNIWLSYAYAENNYQFDDLANSVFPNNVELRHSATLGGTFSSGNFNASAGLKFRTGIPFTPLSQNGLNMDLFDYESANSSNLKDYVRFDISANQSFRLNDRLKAYAGVSAWNLFDRENVINAYYERQGGEINLIRQQALGFTPNFIFRLRF